MANAPDFNSTGTPAPATSAEQNRKRLQDGQPLTFPAAANGVRPTDATVPAEWIQALAANAARTVLTTIAISDALIDGELSLEYVTFEAAVRFERCRFTGPVNFAFTTFRREAVFEDCSFEQRTSFRFAHSLYDFRLMGSNFAGVDAGVDPARETDLRDVRVDGVLNASGTTFGNVSFDRAVFGKRALFGVRIVSGAAIRARFTGWAWFRGVTCAGNFFVDGSIFEGEASFERICIHGFATFGVSEGTDEGEPIQELLQTTFLRGVSFQEAKVLGSLALIGVRFEGPLSFGAAEIHGQTFISTIAVRVGARAEIAAGRFGETSFWRTRFHGNAEFTGVDFAGHVDFGLAWFGSDVRFHPLEVTGPPAVGSFVVPLRIRLGVSFFSARVEGSAHFDGTQFHGAADFERLAVKGTLDCGPCGLRLDPPAFCYTTFHRRLSLSDADVGGIVIFVGARFETDAAFTRFQAASGAFFHAHPSADGIVPTVFRGHADFLEAGIEGTADFSGARFASASFERARIGGNAYWTTVKTANEACGVVFEGPAGFQYMQVGGEVMFSGATLQSAAFDGARISSNLTFAESVNPHQPKPILKPCEFNQQLTLVGATIHSDFVATGCRVDSTFNADGIEVKGVTHFAAARFGELEAQNQFGGAVQFWGAMLHRDAYFFECRFDKIAVFTGLNAMAAVSFEGTKFLDGMSLAGATLKVLRFGGGDNDRRATLRGNFDLRGCTYENIEADWPDLLDHLEPFDRQPYNQLERFLRTGARDREASAVYVRRRRRELRSAGANVFGKPPKPVHGFTGWMRELRRRVRESPQLISLAVQGALFRYGVRPLRLLVFTVAVLAAGTYVFHHPGALTTKPSDPIAAARNLDTNPITWPEAFGYSVRTFSVVELPVGAAWIPASHHRCCRGYLTADAFATIQRVLGFILVPLGIAALTGLLVRKDKT